MLARSPKHASSALAAAVLALLACGRPAPPGADAAATGGAEAAPAPVPEGPRAPSTRRMAERLEELIAATDPLTNPWANPQRVEYARRALASESDPERQLAVHQRLAEELLYAGKPEEAAEEIGALRERVVALGPLAPPALDRELRSLLALAHMRLGEQENCVAHHGVDSCLAPIQGSGVHTDQRGSRAAIGELRALLEEKPGDLGSRWLLNIAAMTVGEYPGGVPEAWRVPPQVFASERPIPRFHDVAREAGVARLGLAGGSVLEDLDGDGDLDLVASSWGARDPLRCWRNEGDGKFTDVTAEAGLEGEVGGLNLTHADYDNDGFADVLVLRGAWWQRAGHLPNSLLRNRGDGRFEDVTEEAGLLRLRPTQVGMWGDYDGDGLLDLFVGNESLPEDPHPSELWHNNGDGTFTDRVADLGRADLGFVKGAAWGDADNDGRADLFVSVMFGENLLFHNDGPRPDGAPGAGAFGWSEVGARAGVTEPRHSFAAWFWDYDNDGWLDLFVAGYNNQGVAEVAALALGVAHRTEVPRLFRNRGDGSFEDVTRAARLDRVAVVMGANHGDLDNDGWLDCYLGTGAPDLRTLLPNRMFRNDDGRRFEDVTTAGGFGHLQKGHGVSFGDVDNDGDQDIFEVIGGAYSGDLGQSVLFENPGFGNHWIALDLVGRRANRSAIGARLRVRVATARGPRTIHALAGAGGSFGESSLRQELGLGDASSIETVEVEWPGSPGAQSFAGLDLDRAYRLIEGEARPQPLDLVRFRLSPGPAAGVAVREARSR